MQNDENACIRYLMKEMDPSEEVLMERAMMEDDDLLIEVESLRQTLKRLDELPRKNPPAHLTESIIQEAADQAKGRQAATPLYFLGTFRYAAAAAAVLLLGAVGGITVYNTYVADEAAVSENGTQSAASADRSLNSAAPSAGGQELNVRPVSDNNVEPWVDRNDILYFQDQFNGSQSDFNAILQTSTEKLTPLSDPFNYTTGSRSLQMTGTGSRE